MLLRGLIFISIAILFTGCKDDLELNAPYKEMPAIYAVLDPSDAKQVVRINKVFLGEGDANVTAKIADSVNYGPGELTVSLKRYIYTTSVSVQVPPAQVNPSMEIFLNEEMITTASGAFSQQQRVYTTTELLHSSGDYVLTVKNNKTGNVFTATSPALEKVKDESGITPFTQPYYPYNPNTNPSLYIDYSTLSKSNVVSFLPNSGKIFQLTIRVHFYDSTVTSNNYDYVDYEFGSKPESAKTSVGASFFMRYEFTRDDFFNAIGVALSRKNLTDNVIGRRFYMIEYLAYSSTQQYADFLQYNSPSFGINQQAPIYSNFENRAAVGLFTFRTRTSVKKQPASTFINEFSRNKNTCKYKFLNSNALYLGCS
jgi:hypothetical protein